LHLKDDILVSSLCFQLQLVPLHRGPNCRYRHAPTTGAAAPVPEAALIGRPGHLHGAPSHMQRYQMALAKQQIEGGGPGGPGGGPGGPGGPGGGAPPPLPPGPPPSSVWMVQQPMALPDAPGDGGDGGGGVGGGTPPPTGGVETGGGDFGGGGSYQVPPLAGGMPGMPGAGTGGEEDHSIPLG
jgi:hypothetical protein